MMMRILDRYVVRAFLSSLLVAMTVLVGLYLLVHFFSHVRYLSGAREVFEAEGTSLFVGICTYYMVHLPELTVLFGPYAIMMAAMYAIHQLEQNNELIPMYAVGVTRLRVALPLVFVTIILSLGLLALREGLVPRIAPDMARYHRMYQGDTEAVDERVPPLRDGRGQVLIAATWDRENRTLSGVNVYTPGRRDPIAFDELVWNSDVEPPRWTTSTPSPDFDPSRETDLEPSDIEIGPRSQARLGFADLRRLTQKRPRRLDLAATLHSHITYPFGPLVLVLIGLPLVMRSRKRNAFIGLGLAVLLSLAFFSTSQILLRMGSQGQFVSPIIAAWIPTIVFGSIGLILFEAPSS